MAAFVGLLGVVLGVLLGKTLERLIDLRRRRDRQIDMVFALHAEIAAGLGAVTEQTAPVEAGHLLRDEYPFGPADRTDFVFQSLKGDVSILPQEVIHSTVRYYKLAEQSNLLVEFIDNPRYALQLPGDRSRYAGHILEKLAEQSQAANEALAALETFITSQGLTVPERHGPRQTSGLIGPAMTSSFDIVSEPNISDERESS